MDVPSRTWEPAPAPCHAQPDEQNQLPAPFRPQIQVNSHELPTELQLRQLPELHHRQVSRADAHQLRGLRQSDAQSSHISHLCTGITHEAHRIFM